MTLKAGSKRKGLRFMAKTAVRIFALSLLIGAAPAWADDELAIQTYQETGATVQYHVDLGEGTKVFTDKAQADAYGQQRIAALKAERTQEAIARNQILYFEGQPQGSPQMLAQWEAQQAADTTSGSHQSNLAIMQEHLREMERVKAENKRLLEKTAGDLDPNSAEYQKQVAESQQRFEEMVESGAKEFQEQLENAPRPVSAKEHLAKIYQVPKVLVSLEKQDLPKEDSSK